jgi:XTP/dITP diphosphohydrolase
MKLLIATSNANKVLEIRPLLAGVPFALLTLADVSAGDPPAETASTYWENARIKAFAYAHAMAEPSIVVAEDSGLEIAGLNGAPGVHSARFMGLDVPYRTRFHEIFRRLAPLPAAAREARFVTALAAVRGSDVVFECEATIDGVITPRPSGEHGFGYDPIFYYAPLQKTTAQLTLEEKCMVSHRARAFRDFARWLRHAELT